MAKIQQIAAREILDSRGNPTIETTVFLDNGTFGTASVPSGASVGSHEAVELRDRDQNRYEGMGVLKAIGNIEKSIAPKLLGTDIYKQQEIDRSMIDLDGTSNKEMLGANAMLSVSMSACRAGAKNAGMPLFLYINQFVKKENQPLKIPTPLFNLINGGKHASSGLNFQEFLVIPPSVKPFSEGLELGVTIYKWLRTTLKTANYSTLVGDEGGFAPNLPTNSEALSLLKQAIDMSGNRAGYDIFLGLDSAANNFYNEKTYHIKEKATDISSRDFISFYEELNKAYHLLYLEDPMSEDDWEGWTGLSEKTSHETIIVGDDLTATNPYRLQEALNKKAISGIVIKPNQIGTILETLAVVEMARDANLKITVAHRSGETNDDFIADFAVGVCADYAKFGAPARGERVAKYNRLLEIEQQLKELKNI